LESKRKKKAKNLHDVEHSALVLYNLSFGPIHYIGSYIWCTRCFECLLYPVFCYGLVLARVLNVLLFQVEGRLGNGLGNFQILG
jgi:hypothetical protein